jgi:hypothetical protein
VEHWFIYKAENIIYPTAAAATNSDRNNKILEGHDSLKRK